MPDTTHPPRSHPTPPHGVDCAQDRRISEIEREVRGIRERLNEGAITMTELRGAVSQLKEAVETLSKIVTELAKPSPIMCKITDAVITWAVPAAILALVWLAVQSGVVPVKPPAINQTHGAAP